MEFNVHPISVGQWPGTFSGLVWIEIIPFYFLFIQESILVSLSVGQRLFPVILNTQEFQKSNYINEEQHRKLEEVHALSVYKHLWIRRSIIMHNNLCNITYESILMLTRFPERDFLEGKKIA